ncbi:uncharacterized protein LOC8275732 [Ricinus communis]|uniref:PAP fibrillin n=1 Tax=Ricinus communis TaxID=3988 RepID=B9T2Q7_RICCO|nr:uncharacterized protein LOC8275732 [Ricinus communis]EEF29860.1 conserved hypothetical protein [Ricinus communis]|eukprot:XP_002532526.1 uncharacterized protein LOC8275732 [Ricinus communis]
MGSQAAAPLSSSFFSSLSLVALNSSQPSKLFRQPIIPFFSVHANATSSLKSTSYHNLKLRRLKTRAALDEKDQTLSTSFLVQEEQELQTQTDPEVEESVKVLKNAAKTRKVPVAEVLSALSVIEKANVDPSTFLDTLGGSASPGRTWMLIFTAQKKLKSGKYFPLTAVQRFDAAGKRIENGVYFGSLGCLTFEGRFTWKKRILAFIFERIRVKIGLLNPLEINLGQKDDREPSTKDPFFIWFYIDEEIAVARGRSGGTAFWVRCRRITA